MYIHVYNIIDTKNKMNFDSNLSVHLLKHAWLNAVIIFFDKLVENLVYN